ncbi:MAG: hypothetical protein R2786_00485 [Flavobacteriaceae bacterium]
MKRVFIPLILIIATAASFGQVGINTSSPDASSMLDISATDKGILIPRMLETQKNSIASPATGLLVFQTDGTDPGFYFYNGSGWDYLTTNGAKEINDLSDGNTNYNSIYLGDGIASSATASSNSNIGIGDLALRYLTDGDFNIAIGPGASENIRTGSNNISIGLSAMSRNRTGDDNIGIGNFSGFNNDTAASGNIFIGTWAGFNEFSGSNKLYIENSTANANNALIYGEFDNDFLRINGTLEVNDQLQVGNYTFPISDGAAGEVLTTDGAGQISWQSTSEVGPSIARATMSGTQSIPAFTSEIINFGVETFDTQLDYNNTTYTYTVPEDGIYRVNSNLEAPTSSLLRFAIFINGVESFNHLGGISPRNMDVLFELNTNDTVQVYLVNTSSTATTIGVIGGGRSYFEIQQID